VGARCDRAGGGGAGVETGKTSAKRQVADEFGDEKERAVTMIAAHQFETSLSSPDNCTRVQ